MTAGFWLAVAIAASAQDYRDYLCKEIQKPFFRVSSKSGGTSTIRMARRLAHDISFESPKPPKTKRILVVGESVAEKLWSAEHDALTEAGAKAWPGWRVEDLNAGMTAYNSRRIAAVLEEGLAYELDAAVVLSGNNEHDALEMCPSVWEGLERQFKRSRLYRTLSGGKRTSEEYARELSLRRHEWQLRRMAKAARAKKVPMALATLPANELDVPPAGQAPLADGDFARGAAALERGRTVEARRFFERRISRVPGDAMAHWFLGRTVEEAGDPVAARGFYEEAVHLDPKGDRASTERNQMIRRVAKEEGAALVDLEKAFREAAKNGPIGADWLADGVHWHPRLNGFVAAKILSALGAPVSANAARPASPEQRREELLTTLLYAIRNASYWAGTDRQGALSEVSVALLERVDREGGDWLLKLSRSKAAMRPKLTANFWVQDLAADQDQWWPVYQAHLGEAYRRIGKAGLAIEFFDHALEASPGRYRTRLWRALALKSLGRTKEADAELAALAAFDDAVVKGVAAAY